VICDLEVANHICFYNCTQKGDIVLFLYLTNDYIIVGIYGGSHIMMDVRFELDCDMSSIHFHDEMEIMYVLSGRVAVMMNGSNFVLSSEDLVVFNPYEYHEHYKEPGSHILSMFVSPDILYDVKMGDIKCNSRINLEQEDYLTLLKSKIAILYKDYSDTDHVNGLSIRSHLYDILSVLRQYFENNNISHEDNSKEIDRIRKVLVYVQEHFSEDINLQDVADMVFWSKGHFSREFQKRIGVNFSDYIRKLRLNKAAYMLRTTRKSVTEISLACGFANTNTMIINFRKEFSETPGAYQKKHMEAPDDWKVVGSEETISYMPLLKYASMNEQALTLKKEQQIPICAKMDLDKAGRYFKTFHNEAVFVGFAKDLLLDNMKNAVQRAMKEIGFRYGIISGILDDCMDVYHEDENGQPFFSFTYMDMVLDFFMSIGLKPWFEFGNMPRKLIDGEEHPFGSSYINLPYDMSKWRSLVENTIRHLVEHYGYEECQTWRFATINGVYTTYNIFSEEGYLEFWRETYRGIKSQLPNARVNGWTLDSGLVRKYGEETLLRFIEYCKREKCMPDEFAFQIFQSDYKDNSLYDTRKKIANGSGQQKEEPMHISFNPNILSEELLYLRHILDKHVEIGCPMIVSRWNSSAWQGELGNDTCYKSALIFKGYLENEDKISCLSYAGLTDITERKLTNVGMFFGGMGVMTYQGVPKAGYYALRLLNEMAGILVDKGDGYVVTRSEDKRKIQIAVYHYCHFNPETHLDKALSQEEQRTYDRYHGFVNVGIKTIQFNIAGLLEGDYDRESYIINREYGSSYDLWMRMGAPDVFANHQVEYIDHMSEPQYRYDKFHVGKEGEIVFSVAIEPHEVRLICLRKK
jgi:xylan 1,4-beta-xylosidase